MLNTFAALRNTVRLRINHIYIDNVIFKLHYRATFVLLLVGCVMVTSQQYIGEHIKCIVSHEKEFPVHVVNTFCFFTTTYTVVKHLNVTSLQMGYIPHPGVGPVARYSDDEIIRHGYYQWVPFVLFFQAMCFYVPHIIWKSKEGGRLKMLVLGLRMGSMALNDKSFTIGNTKYISKSEKIMEFERIKKEFICRLHNNSWAYWMVFCEILNVANLVLQLFFTNWFLGRKFYRLGTTVMKTGLDSEIDVLDEVFPKVTKCDFYKYGASGTIQKHDALCVMALNVVNEKFYLILWFWFVILATFTFLGILWRLLTLCLHSRSVKFNTMLFSWTCMGKLERWHMQTVTKYAKFPDWLFLYYIAKNMDGYVFKEFFVALATNLPIHNDQPLRTPSPYNSADEVDYLPKPDDDTEISSQEEHMLNDV